MRTRASASHKEVGSMRRLVFLLFAGALAAVLVLPGVSSADRSAPVQLFFTKSLASSQALEDVLGEGALSGSVYIGAIDGGGTIEMLVLDRRSTEDGQHFTAVFRVDVGENPNDRWFAAEVRGTFEFATLRTRLEGRVVGGNWLRGAKVLEEGQLVSAAPLTFEGTLTLQPRGGDD
jgi:hypothetical protein